MFEADSMLSVVDTHTQGEPTRIITHGLPRLAAGSVADQRLSFMRDFDHVRRAVILEPRGHQDMFAAVLVKAAHPDADLGVIFMDAGGYLNMCVHGTIGLVTAGLNLGFLPQRSPVAIETPAGLVSARWQRDAAQDLAVTVRNVPAFVYRDGVPLQVGGRSLRADVVFAGNFFALVDAGQFGQPIEPGTVGFWRQQGRQILHVLNEQIKVAHPLLPGANRIDLVEFYSEQGLHRYTNITVFGRGQFDRSPCGTGTTAKLALLHHHGRLKPGEPVESFSVLGSRFLGQVAEVTRVGEWPAVVAEITGKAYITGMGQLVLQSRDPFRHGFGLQNDELVGG